MNDKQLLQVLEGLGKNSRKSRSFAASDVVEGKGEMKEREDQLCAATIRKIVENSNSNSSNRRFAASDPSLSSNPNRNVNRVRVLTEFIFKNDLR